MQVTNNLPLLIPSKSPLAMRVFHTLGISQLIFSYLAPYEVLVSQYQHLNRRFYDAILPKLHPTLQLNNEKWL